MMKVDLSVVIGRFQPFHFQHLALVKEALTVSDSVLICIGSVNEQRSQKNPLTYEQRKVIITTTLINAGIDINCVTFIGLEDKPTDEVWANQVHQAVSEIAPLAKVTLVGHHKDDSSYYLDIFKQYGYHEFHSNNDLSATQVRSAWFSYEGDAECLGRLVGMVDQSIAKLLVQTRNQEWFKNLIYILI